MGVRAFTCQPKQKVANLDRQNKWLDGAVVRKDIADTQQQDVDKISRHEEHVAGEPRSRTVFWLPNRGD